MNRDNMIKQDININTMNGKNPEQLNRTVLKISVTALKRIRKAPLYTNK